MQKCKQRTEILLQKGGGESSCEITGHRHFSPGALGTESPPCTASAATHQKNATLRTSTHSHLFWQSLSILSPTWSKSHPRVAAVLVLVHCSIHTRVPRENTQGIHMAKIIRFSSPMSKLKALIFHVLNPYRSSPFSLLMNSIYPLQVSNLQPIHAICHHCTTMVPLPKATKYS